MHTYVCIFIYIHIYYILMYIIHIYMYIHYVRIYICIVYMLYIDIMYMYIYYMHHCLLFPNMIRFDNVSGIQVIEPSESFRTR